MRKRAEQVDQTRQRITDAAIRLHTTIGPARASLSAIAEEAGVTRLTLYRHFKTPEELFAACMGHWRATNPPPDPEAWRTIQAFDDRVRSALRDQYSWYRAHADELYPIYRDTAAIPAATLNQQRMNNAQMVDALLDGLSAADSRTRKRRAVLGHLVAFRTWYSLGVDQRLSDEDVLDLAVAFALAV